MHHRFAGFLPLSLCLSVACTGSDPAAGSGGTGGGSGSSGAGGSSSCPLTITVDQKDTYDATWCNIQGAKTFASGVYQISVASRFNDVQPIRSIDFLFNDSDLDTETHVKTFPVGVANPGVNSTYRPSPTDEWVTLDNQNVVGSGSFDLGKYDRTSKLFSGTFDIVVKQGAEAKSIKGTFVDVPMQTAE